MTAVVFAFRVGPVSAGSVAPLSVTFTPAEAGGTTLGIDNGLNQFEAGTHSFLALWLYAIGRQRFLAGLTGG